MKLPFKTRMSRVEANKQEATELFKDKNFVMAIQHYVSTPCQSDA